MIKHELREQGFSVTEHYQKKAIIVAVWVIVFLLMIAGTFYTLSWIGGAEYKTIPVVDFFDKTAYEINNLFIIRGFTSVIYLISWIGIGLTLYFLVKRQTNLIRVVLPILILIMIFFFMLLIFDSGRDDNPIFFGIFDLVLNLLEGEWWALSIFIILVLLYLVLKLVMTILFCSDKIKSIQLNFIKFNMMPICHCREALKTWHIITAHLFPAVFMYLLLFILSVRGENAAFMMMFLYFMLFFISFDIMAVIYVLIFKLRYKPDFISLDYHVYDVTLFKQTYVSFGNKSAQRHTDTKVTDTYINKKVFTTITTCLDIECDNYAKQLDNTTKKCSLCGKRKYKTRALADMKTCSNVECENYGHELKGEMAVCSLCGGTMEKFIINYNPVWSTASIGISIISVVVFCSVYWLSAGESLGIFADSFRNVILVANIVMGIMSKRKAAIIISVAAALFTMGVITALLNM
jgi:hypothetical protein